MHAESRLTLWDPMDCSPPGSSVHGISQASILEWVAISSFRWSAWLRNWTHASCSGRQILHHWANNGSLIFRGQSHHCFVNRRLNIRLNTLFLNGIQRFQCWPSDSEAISWNTRLNAYATFGEKESPLLYIDEPICRAGIETQMYRMDSWTQLGRRGWEKLIK